VGEFSRAAHYRQRAAEMLRWANLAHSLEVRFTFLNLARNWEVLAEQVEHKHFARA
jgi:hypothetical protein